MLASITQRSPAPPTPANTSFTKPSASTIQMFSNSHNLVFTGGTYNHVENHAQRRGIDLLLDASSPGAFHNSGERFDPPKCHPNTRVVVLSKIMDWVIARVGWDGLILWLYGPAGAGKSAILQTIAELCHDKNILLASYFFSRTDSKRNNEKYLIASLAYQITVNIPQARDLIEAAINHDRAIFHRSLQVQLSALIMEPLFQLSQTGIFHSTPVPHLIIIDGLEECWGVPVQHHIIHTIASALSQHSVNLKVLISSRPEHEVVLEFSKLSLNLLECVYLDNTYHPDVDIERYLKDSFHQIKTNHPFMAHIPSEWPTNEALAVLVGKSSGQFIYAATVIKYISSDRHLPTKRLEVILGLQSPQNDKPYAELDALYIGILSSVEDLPTTLQMLGVLILTDLHKKTPAALEEFMFLGLGDIRHLLFDLASVIECAPGVDSQIQMFHASFPDFLLDLSRSKEYHINPFLMHAQLALHCIKHIDMYDLAHEQDQNSTQYYSFNSLVFHCSRAGPTAILHQKILNTSYIPVLFKSWCKGFKHQYTAWISGFLSFLKTSNFLDTKELYLHHQKFWDTMIHQRMGNIPSGLGLAVFLVFINLEIDTNSSTDKLVCYLNAGQTSWHHNIVLLLYPGVICTYPGLITGCNAAPAYHTLLQEFFADPSRAGKYFLDGTKYSMVAEFLLHALIHPYSLQRHFHHFQNDHIIEILDAVPILLSKAGPSDNLIALINHTNLIFHKCCDKFKDELQPIVEQISNYLLKFHGSAPIGLQITINEEPDPEEWDKDSDSIISVLEAWHKGPHPPNMNEGGNNAHIPNLDQMMFKRSCDIYAQHMSKQGRGTPLWIPEPSETLPLEYRRSGITIGDVGIITEFGAFDFLFNICIPTGHPSNPEHLPKNFMTLHIPREDIHRYSEFGAESYLSSSTIPRSQRRGQDSSGLTFEAGASEGAILTMPVGTISEDVKNIHHVQDFVAGHADGWYLYAIRDRCREVKNGDLRVVIGYDKTEAWGMATFSDATSQEGARHLKFWSTEENAGRTYRWECSGNMQVRTGPDPRQVEELRRDEEGVQYQNQALFVRTLNVTLQDQVWKSLPIDFAPNREHMSWPSNRLYRPPSVTDNGPGIALDIQRELIDEQPVPETTAGKEQRHRKGKDKAGKGSLSRGFRRFFRLK